MESSAVTTKPKVLIVRGPDGGTAPLPAELSGAYEAVEVHDAAQAQKLLTLDGFAGVVLLGHDAQHWLSPAAPGELPTGGDRLLERERILQCMPDGVVVIDSDNRILWANDRLRGWTSREPVMGESFYTVLGSPEILGPDFCPFHTALVTGQPSYSTLRTGDSRFFRIHASALADPHGPPRNLVVTVRDVTVEMQQQEKLAAIRQAGVELANLNAKDLTEMSIDERIELLKQNILHYANKLLSFDVIEIRLLDQKTGRLEPLLAERMLPEAASRVLHAQAQGNGVTGFVAATGKSYLCEDTAEDPLFIEGCKGARSSLTVPLTLHDEVIGTFNVESPEPRAFTENDLQFLEIFARDVALALNTLELLAAEKVSTTAANVEAIHSAVALPIDDILNDAVNVMERYIGHDPEVAERLQRILRNARDIKTVIQKVGQKMAPTQAVPQGQQPPERPALVGLQVLVADEDNAVRSAAHALLERYGCVVECAHSGHEALSMIRGLDKPEGYDVVIADIRLPDMNGYEFRCKLKERIGTEMPPLVLMTGFGYDSTHSIANARREGQVAVLYKPFRLDQLLDAVEKVVPVRQQT